MNVSIIIVNYNTIKLIIDSINSIIEKTTDISYEIIVVDNNSIDNSSQIISQMFGNNIKFIQLNSNIGFGLANNEGLKIAIGKNILFLNPDTIIINNAIKILSDYLDNSIETAACGGNLFNEDMYPSHSFMRFFPSIKSEFNDLFYNIPGKILFGRNSEHNYSNKVINVAYITGADLMIKKRVLDEIGDFSPSFFMFFEETDICYRIHKAKYKIRSIPNAKIQHLEGKSIDGGALSKKKIIFFQDSKKKYLNQKYSKLYVKVFNAIHIVNIVLKMIILKRIKPNLYPYWKATFEVLNSKKV